MKRETNDLLRIWCCLLFFGLNFSACVNCNYVDCAGDDVKSIQYVSATDGVDLFKSQRYSIDSLRIMPVFEEGGGDREPYIDVLAYTNFNYYINLGVNEDVKGFVLQLADLPPDTLLAVKGIDPGGKCCGPVTTIEDVVLNGDTLHLDRFEFDIVIAK